jgi:catechol 2,3-dioxygenase-like lactoylglutathione lyase family enzyme
MIGRVHAFVLDCPDPAALARFYAELTGWALHYEDPDWVVLRGEGAVGLAFQRAPDHQPPRWPDPNHPQQAHIDLHVPDLDDGERQVLALGATALPTPPDAEKYRVYADPAGHPFCLCLD